jgi:hypothetical protein
MGSSSNACRVVLLEINEISWELMQPWLDRGELPHFELLRRRGICGRTMADEPQALLDPWITWTTVFTGVPQPEHGMVFLEQPPETIRHKRLWDLVADAGKSVGVFGSVSSWPPRPVTGFFVPGAFSPDSQTYPEHLRPIQELNLRYTRAHAPGAKQPGLGSMLMTGLRLIKKGLNVRTGLGILSTLLEIKRHPERDWKKVSLQPLVNAAFFRKLYRKHRPDFSTFHTNHVAHYQHRFLRAHSPEHFPDSTDPAEISRFGDAIHYGYLTADRLLGQFIKLCQRDQDLVLLVASSMGQKPWIPARFDNVAPLTCRIRSIERLLQVLALEGRCEYFSTMAPQWNLRITDVGLRQRVMHDLHSARYQPVGKPMYHVQESQETLVITPVSHHGIDSATTCVFPTLESTPSFPFDELVVQADDTRKSGCHDPVGMFAFYGTPVRKACFIEDEVNNLDIAPTVLSLLGLPVPAYMKGRVLSEVVAGPVEARVAAVAS